MAEQDILIEDRDPWDQQEGEPSFWYDRFTRYRLLGPSRTMRKLWRMIREEEGRTDLKINQSAPSVWNEKHKLWNWKQRAEAWDQEQRDAREDEAEAILSQGLALAHKRVIKLQELAAKIEKHLMDERTVKPSPYVIEQYRGILDDIAKEKGERSKETRIVGANGGPILIETAWGRGGSASLAWENQQLLTTVAEEKPEEGTT